MFRRTSCFAVCALALSWSLHLLAADVSSRGRPEFETPAADPMAAAYPSLTYLSYFGTEGRDMAGGVAVDPQGNVVLVGSTDSANLPGRNGVQPGFGGVQDAFVVKLDPTGSRILWSTYLGGHGADSATSVTVDRDGFVYVAGVTSSTDFPSVADSYTFGTPDQGGVFIAKLTPDGRSLVFVARLACSVGVGPLLAVAPDGSSSVAISTGTGHLPPGQDCARGPRGNCTEDVYVWSVTPDGRALRFGRYHGISYQYYPGPTVSDRPRDLAVRADGVLYLTYQASTGSAWLVVETSTSSVELSLPAAATVAVAPDDRFALGMPGSLEIRAADMTTLVSISATHEPVAFDGDALHVVSGWRPENWPSWVTPPGFEVATYSASSGDLRGSLRVYAGLADGPSTAASGRGSMWLFGTTDAADVPTRNAFQSVPTFTNGAVADTVLARVQMRLGIDGISPAVVDVDGASPVTLTGGIFMPGTTVTIGGLPAGVAYVNPITLVAWPGPHSPGRADVIVTNPDGDSFRLPDGVRFDTCAPQWTMDSIRFGAGGGTASVRLNVAAEECGWSLSASAAWLHVTSETSGTGSATVTLAVDANHGPPRTATLQSGRASLFVTQAAQGSILRVDGDQTGDGFADLVTFNPSLGTWSISGMPPITWGITGDVAVPADYDGDGPADIAVYRPSIGKWFIRGGEVIDWGRPGDVPVPADYDGDGRADVAVFRPSSGVWYVRDHDVIQWGRAADVPVPADYDGDGRADVAVFRPATGTWWIVGSVPIAWGAPGDVPVPADYDGDGRTDLAVYRPSTGLWFVRDQFTREYGRAGDIPVALDYDGDGRADLAVYRRSVALWYLDGRGAGVPAGRIRDIPARVHSRWQTRLAHDVNGDGLTDLSVARDAAWRTLHSARDAWWIGSELVFGAPTDVRRTADVDGDGRLDLILFRPATAMWYVARSSTEFHDVLASGPWGLVGDIAVPADYDGDRRADRAVFRPSEARWYIDRSSDGTRITAEWGRLDDVPVPADYDGDGIADLAVYRPQTGTWFVRRSSDAATVTLDWGLGTDVPAPADYDGDGMIDPAVFRPSDGSWWVRESRSGWMTSSRVEWGLAGDVPVPGDYDNDGKAESAVYRPGVGLFVINQGLVVEVSEAFTPVIDR